MLRAISRSAASLLRCPATFLQQQLPAAACAVQQQQQLVSERLLFPAPAVGCGWQRGFAVSGDSSSGGSSGGGTSSRAGGQQQDEAPVQQEQQAQPQKDQQQQQQQQQQQEVAAGKRQDTLQPQAAAAADETGQAQQEVSTSQQLNASNQADLQQYIQQLKELRGSTTVLRQQLGGDTSLFEYLWGNTAGAFIQNAAQNMIKGRIETEFDVTEFLEGAKDAFWIVHKLLADGDWETVKKMVSAKMFEALYDTWRMYNDDGLLWRTTLESDISEAGIRGAYFMGKQEMASFDAEQAALVDDDFKAPLPGGTWLVLTVQMKAKQLTTITRAEDGLIVAETVDLRPVRWRFARGPLPGNLPVKQLDAEWFLLSI